MLQQTSHYFLDYQIRGHMSCCCFELDLNLKIYSNHYKGRKTALWIFCIKKRIDKVLIGEMRVAKLRFWQKNLPLFKIISIRVT